MAEAVIHRMHTSGSRRNRTSEAEARGLQPRCTNQQCLLPGKTSMSRNKTYFDPLAPRSLGFGGGEGNCTLTCKAYETSTGTDTVCSATNFPYRTPHPLGVSTGFSVLAVVFSADGEVGYDRLWLAALFSQSLLGLSKGRGGRLVDDKISTDRSTDVDPEVVTLIGRFDHDLDLFPLRIIRLTWSVELWSHVTHRRAAVLTDRSLLVHVATPHAYVVGVRRHGPSVAHAYRLRGPIPGFLP